MRFYMYIDKDFLKNLVSVSGNLDFNIQFIEYAVENSFTNRNDISVKPFFEKAGDKSCEIHGVYNDKDDEKNSKQKSRRSGNIGKDGVGFSFDNSVMQSISTEKKYINIEDISDMKNINFYHNLVESIRNTTRDSASNITEEYGFLDSLSYLRSDKDYGESCKIFKVNESYIWYDKSKLVSDIDFLTNISSKVNVIGYTLNKDEQRNKKIMRAIAIFVE